MQHFPDLVRRHRVDPGALVHVGDADGEAIPAYYEAGFTDITVVDTDPERLRALRTRFPGVDAKQVTEFELDGFRLDAVTSKVQVLVVNMPGHELTVLASAPWDRLSLLVVETSAHLTVTHATAYDLVTEVVTTRGFVEVDRWTRSGEVSDLRVAFNKVS